MKKLKVMTVIDKRPEIIKLSASIMVGLEKEIIMQSLSILDPQERDALRIVADYSMPNVLDKVLRIILSYTNYVNRVVWKK